MSDDNLPPPPPSAQPPTPTPTLGDTVEKAGCAITRLVLWGGLFLIILLVVIGAIVGGGDNETADAPPVTTGTDQAEAPEPVTGVEEGEAEIPITSDDDPARAAVVALWGRCIAAADPSLDLNETAVVILDEETERVGVPIRAVVFPGGQIVFRVQLDRGSLPATAKLPVVTPNNDATNALLDLGLANDPDCS